MNNVIEKLKSKQEEFGMIGMGYVIPEIEKLQAENKEKDELINEHLRHSKWQFECIQELQTRNTELKECAIQVYMSVWGGAVKDKMQEIISNCVPELHDDAFCEAWIEKDKEKQESR